MPSEDGADPYQRHSVDGLMTAVEYGAPGAYEALKEFIRLRTAGRNTVVERHRHHGHWRVREPQSSNES